MRKAFTLTELLVVIGITAVLSAGILTYIGRGASMRSRNAKRQADLEQIRSTLERYRANNGRYPACGGGCSTATLTTFLGTLPTDPTAGAVYGYLPFASAGACGNGPNDIICTGYGICATLERPRIVQTSPFSMDFPACNYWLYNP